MPPKVVSNLSCEKLDDVIEIVLDIGRVPEVRHAGGKIEKLQCDVVNDEDIKFVCCAKGEDFLHFINEVSSSNNEYSMLDFYNELTLSIDEECKKNLMKVMNDLSLIIFEKDLKLEYSMEKILKEALTQVLSKYQKTK